jgi:hypothetical protein
MSIEERLLPNLIIFENNNLKEEERTLIINYLEQKDYTLFHEPVSTLAIK